MLSADEGRNLQVLSINNDRFFLCIIKLHYWFWFFRFFRGHFCILLYVQGPIFPLLQGPGVECIERAS